MIEDTANAPIPQPKRQEAQKKKGASKKSPSNKSITKIREISVGSISEIKKGFHKNKSPEDDTVLRSVDSFNVLGIACLDLLPLLKGKIYFFMFVVFAP